MSGVPFDNEESPAASPGSDLEASLPTSRNPTSSDPVSPDEGPSPTEPASTMPQASGTAGTGRGADGPARATSAQAPPQDRAPSTADPQTVAPNTQLDPTVEFEWPEWQADEEDSCRGGTYTGTFRCTFTDATGLLVVQLEGPVSEIAVHGGTAPVDCDASQGACHFDMTAVPNLAEALTDALKQITTRAVSCEFDAPRPQTGELDLSLVNVVYTPGDGSAPQLVVHDARVACNGGANGWQFVAGNTRIRLCGEACDLIRADPGGGVEVVLGCPVQGPQ
ncbi:MAG: hypothetical protein OXR73_21265 [Myxococcales bacterium]|nr:hypothetical protein [Myxococcales bacterium]